jgi:phage tail-like protein
MTASLTARGLMPDHPNPLPVRDRLPGVLSADLVTQQFCAGLDEALGPVVLTLDCLPAYLDPDTTPADMLGWLGDWLGVALDPRQSLDEQRDLLRRTGGLLRWRGTARGVREAVEFAVGVTPEIVETGAAEWSERPGTELPGTAGADLVVRVRLADTRRATVRRLEDAVAAVVPAHIRYAVEVVAAT